MESIYASHLLAHILHKPATILTMKDQRNGENQMWPQSLFIPEYEANL